MLVDKTRTRVTEAGAIVITSIQAPTASVRAFAGHPNRQDAQVLVIGDRKSPASDWPSGVEFFSIDDQKKLGFQLAGLLPENHYCRKNLGYLVAMARSCAFIYDTDDDNSPLDTWCARSIAVAARACNERDWVNAYQWFSDRHIWPRGLPLSKAHGSSRPAPLGEVALVDAPIQQGLANGSPDVDAVWRLLLDQPVEFHAADSVCLMPGAWCPFNSQSTWWHPAAYALLYLPSFVSFRMTDIWRSFIAQRCLWAMGCGVVFHGPEVFQDRNPHNLMRDFEQEIPGYLGNERIRQVLESLNLESGPQAAGANLRHCYEALARAGFVEARELPVVDAWLADVAAATRTRRGSA